MAMAALLLLGAGLACSAGGAAPSRDQGAAPLLDEGAVCPEHCSCSLGEGGELEGAVCGGSVEDAGAMGPSLASLQVEGCLGEGDWGSGLLSLEITGCDNFTLAGFTRLQSLAISDSLLPPSLPCSLLQQLTNLSLTSSSLSSLALLPSSCPYPIPLLSLDLSSNLLSSLSWPRLHLFPLLQRLSLAHNPLLEGMLPPSQPLPHLSSLSLLGCPRLSSLCTSLLSSLPSLSSLDLTGSGLTSLPMHLLLLPNLSSLSLPPSFTPPCSCTSTLLLSSLPSSHPLSSLSCRLPAGRVLPASSLSILSSLSCSPPSLPASQPSHLTLLPGTPVTLDCPATSRPLPTVIWRLPSSLLLRWRPDPGPACEVQEEVLGQHLGEAREAPGIQLHSNGSLVIQEFGWRDRGTYTCYVDNRFGNSSLSVELELEFQYRNVLYYWSILFGVVTAVCFLVLTLAGKLLHYLLWNYGCCCCCPCCKQEPAPRIKRLTTMVDSIETYRIQQLEKLRENYQANSERIRDNYSMQVERMRDHYSSSRGVPQVATDSYLSVKEQYWDQVSRMRDYSNSQLARTHENYIFQRQKLRKFSAQNYLKIRETGKYTQKTLNRVRENMPAVGDLTSCRQIQRPPDWEERRGDLDLGLELEQIRAELDGLGEEDGSCYFTPRENTPVREVVGEVHYSQRSEVRTHRRITSNLSNFFPFWWGMGQGDPVTTVAIVEPLQGEHVREQLREPLQVEQLREPLQGGGDQGVPPALKGGLDAPDLGGRGAPLAMEGRGAPLAMEETCSLLEEDFMDASETQGEAGGLEEGRALLGQEGRGLEDGRALEEGRSLVEGRVLPGLEDRAMNLSQGSLEKQGEHGTTTYIC